MSLVEIHASRELAIDRCADPQSFLPQIALRERWRKYDAGIKSRLLDHLAQKEFELAYWKATPPEDRLEFLRRWRAEYQDPGGWADGWDGFLKAIPCKQFHQFPLLDSRCATYRGMYLKLSWELGKSRPCALCYCCLACSSGRL